MGHNGLSAALEDLVAGAVAGGASRMAVAPLDVLKIRFQVQGETGGVYRYSSIASAVRQIFEREGLTAFWKGNLPAMLMIVPYSSVQFATFYGLKLAQVIDWGEPQSSLILGGVSGICATVSTYPLDLLRTRLAAQAEPRIYRNVTHAVKTIYERQGLSGFYAGLTPTVVEIAPYIALSFGIYETAKAARISRTRQLQLNVSESVAIGGVTGMLAKLCTLPLDNAKKRLQVQGQFSQRRYAGMLDVLASSVRENGFRSLFRGATPSILKAAPNSAITFAVFEATKRILAQSSSLQETEES